MNLIILAIGKKKSDYDPMIKEYQKRISAPFSLTLEIIEPHGVDNASLSSAKESEKLLSKIKIGDYVVALDELGRDFSTVEFSELIDAKLHNSHKRMVFIIGGAYGIDKTVRMRADMIMQLGSLTFPHELARLIIVEQLYRATNFLGGGKYHHE